MKTVHVFVQDFAVAADGWHFETDEDARRHDDALEAAIEARDAEHARERDTAQREAREARERAIEEAAKAVEEFADETDSDPERLAVLSAALAVRALTPVPTAEAAKEKP